jgi:hypothetical protein
MSADGLDDYGHDYDYDYDYDSLDADGNSHSNDYLDTILNPPRTTTTTTTTTATAATTAAPTPTPSTTPPNMPSQPRASRLPNGYVDLTAPDSPPQRRKRDSPAAGPSAKRQKREDGSGSGSGSDASKSPAAVDEVDLTADPPTVEAVLQKQREDAIKAQTQAQHDEKPTTFSTLTCVICMDTPTDLTATACGATALRCLASLDCTVLTLPGHLFCHTCLMEALIAGENRTGPGEPKRSQCPVCRKFINRTKASDIIPLLLKKGLATQPRRVASKA